MFYVTHFRTEFIKRDGANIMSKVTMTQFMLLIAFSLVGVGLFKAPLMTTPLFMLAGYAAGYKYNGEILIRRAWAYLYVWGRSLVGQPRLVNLQTEWEAAQTFAQDGQLGDPFDGLPAAIVIDELD
jgi:hypothetical protein